MVDEKLGPGNKDGYESGTESIVKFATVMDSAGSVVSRLRETTPKFNALAGWLPVVPGMPAIGAFYYERFNAIAGVWADCAGILQEVLEVDSEKLYLVAKNYTDASGDAHAAVGEIGSGG
ncbi:hypothetical protein ACQPYK_05745 [Streptosporangium sp. CA-135522]|uniref:hypothetical protein n=1 Tax=Streptosporangium sp. CA-135522 TaxID=3240072 RepID=UPI003D89F125